MLNDLLQLRGPGGQEDEVREYCEKVIKKNADDVFIDEAGNLIALLKGKKNSSPIRLVSHLDELSLIVKRVEEDGRLAVQPIGGIFPFDIGQGPVDILGDKKVLPGVLSAPSIHTTVETAARWRTMPDGGNKARNWEDTFIFTGKTPSELASAGVYSGTRVVIAKVRRQPFAISPYVGGYFMDNRAAVAIQLQLWTELYQQKKRTFPDLYAVFSTEEESGCHGASYASRTLPGEVTIAIDVAPSEKEYGIEMNDQPVIVYQDRVSLYTKSLSDALVEAAYKVNLKPQTAVLGRYASDASYSKHHGQAAQAALVCIPTMNTHGYEIIHSRSIENGIKLLKAFFLNL